jgi:phytoene synthase
VFGGKETSKLRAALGQLIGEARGHLDTAFKLVPAVPPEVRPVFLPLAGVARELERASRADADLFMPHATSRLRTLWTLWRASRSRLFRA